MPEYCQDCGRQRLPGEFVCPDERCRDMEVPTVYLDHIPAGKVPDLVMAPLAGPLGEAGRGLPYGSVMLMFGPPGQGKTTLAYMSMPGADVISTEMTPTLVRQYQAKWRLPLTNSWKPMFDEEGLPYLGLPDPPPPEYDLILDSASDLGRYDAMAVKQIIQWCEETGARAIVIVHETAQGTPWGGTTIPHDVHAVVRVFRNALGQREAFIVKDRSNPPTAVSNILLGRGQEEDESAQQYYSVEGKTSDYSLAAFPHASKATRTDVFKFLEGKLPPPPVAVAAAASDIHEEGWSEPPDWRQRAAFANAHKIAYFSPIYGLIEPEQAEDSPKPRRRKRHAANP